MQDLEQRELKLNTSSQRAEDRFDLLSDKYMNTIGKISNIFFEENYEVEDAIIVLESLLTAMTDFKADNYITLDDIKNL